MKPATGYMRYSIFFKGKHRMSYYRGPLIRPDGSPIIPEGQAHNCYYRSGWNRPYSHTTVATVLTDSLGRVAAVVARHPNEPAEGGKLALAGGYVELGQTVAETAVTEVLEETGYGILAGTLGRFAIMDGPTSLPGRTNENDLNNVHVYYAQAGEKVQEHDSEVTDVQWISQDAMPPREAFAFGHFDIIRMWYRHRQRPFENLPIVPSGMNEAELFLPDEYAA